MNGFGYHLGNFLSRASSYVISISWSKLGYYGRPIGQTIIFSCCGLFFFFFFLSFFPRLISAAADWMSAILPHMVWP